MSIELYKITERLQAVRAMSHGAMHIDSTSISQSITTINNIGTAPNIDPEAISKNHEPR